MRKYQKYKKHLEKSIEKRFKELPFLETKRKQIGLIIDLAYPIVSEILNNEGPMFLDEIAEILAPVLYPGKEYLVSHTLNRYSELFMPKHKIKMTSLRKAIEDFRGNFDYLKGFRFVDKNILYASKKSLEVYIKAHTKTEKKSGWKYDSIIIHWVY